MAPFPTRRNPVGSSLLPTIHSASQSSSTSTSSPHSYPPLPPSTSTTPSHSPVGSRSPSFSYPRTDAGESGAQSFARKQQMLDPQTLFGGMSHPSQGSLKGLAGHSWESKEAVRKCLEDNHINSHTFFNDKGFHNHCAHHLLAAYSLGGSPSLLEEILTLHKETASKPMPPLAPIDVTEHNWTEYLGDERFYPNYLAFFHRLISTPPPPTSPYYGRPSSVVPVIEQYLLGGEGQMLVRAVSGAIHPLIHIGHGVEFELDSIVAEGLAQCAVHKPAVSALFPSNWPPAPPKPSQIQSAFSSAFSSLRLSSSTTNYFGNQPIAASTDNFAATAASLPRSSDDRRYPREGLSGFTILARILSDDSLAAGNANQLSDMSKLDAVLRNRGSRIAQLCGEWKFSTERSQEWDDEETEVNEGRKSNKGKSAKGWGAVGVPSWEEVVEKTEELFWMSTVIYAAATRPGYKNVKLDFFTMHGVTSALFLPPLLEAISPHLRPYLLTSHFRVMVAYWVSRGRPDLYIEETLMAAPAQPQPPNEPHPTSQSAVARSVDEIRRDTRASSTGDKNSQEKEPLSPLHSNEDLDEPPTPKAGTSNLPLPVMETVGLDNEELRIGTNPWMKVLQSAVDHDDEHVTKTVRSLYFAASHFDTSPPGYFTSSLPGSQTMDGSIFIRAAGLTLSSIGWAHEGDKGIVGTWDRSALGYNETWADDELLPGARMPGSLKGKMRENSASSSRSSLSSFGGSGVGGGRPTSSSSKSQSGSIMSPRDVEAGHFSGPGDSALLSPRLAHVNGFASSVGGKASPRSSAEYNRRSQEPERVGWRKVGEELSPEELEEEEAQRRREEEERELMA
ncbi:questin oxidase family protein [Sporobolomyces salmoneus]|uniref:questin oxidase family protein n=1 Tax=Sporobolomyces salmoneus TaxID=183962 RepID=UPI00316C33E1